MPETKAKTKKGKGTGSKGGVGGGGSKGNGVVQSVLGLQQQIGNQSTVDTVLGSDVMTEFMTKASRGSKSPLFFTTSTYKQLKQMLGTYAAKQGAKSGSWRKGQVGAMDSLLDKWLSKEHNLTDSTKSGTAKRDAIQWLSPKVKEELRNLRGDRQQEEQKVDEPVEQVVAPMPEQSWTPGSKSGGGGGGPTIGGGRKRSWKKGDKDGGTRGGAVIGGGRGNKQQPDPEPEPLPESGSSGPVQYTSVPMEQEEETELVSAGYTSNDGGGYLPNWEPEPEGPEVPKPDDGGFVSGGYTSNDGGGYLPNWEPEPEGPEVPKPDDGGFVSGGYTSNDGGGYLPNWEPEPEGPEVPKPDDGGFVSGGYTSSGGGTYTPIVEPEEEDEGGTVDTPTETTHYQMFNPDAEVSDDSTYSDSPWLPMVGGGGGGDTVTYKRTGDDGVQTVEVIGGGATAGKKVVPTTEFRSHYQGEGEKSESKSESLISPTISSTPLPPPKAKAPPEQLIDELVDVGAKWPMVHPRQGMYKDEFTRGSIVLQTIYKDGIEGGKTVDGDGKRTGWKKRALGGAPLTRDETQEYLQHAWRWNKATFEKYWDQLVNTFGFGYDLNPQTQTPEEDDDDSDDTTMSDDSEQEEVVGPTQGPMGAPVKVKEKKTDEERAKYRLKLGGTIMRGAEESAFDTAKMTTNKSGAGFGIFVMGSDGQVYAGTHKVGIFHHSSFLAGGKVAGAGEMKVTGGKLAHLTNKSGHYIPTDIHNLQVIEELKDSGIAPGSYSFTTFDKSDTRTEYATAKDYVEEMSRKSVKAR